MKKRIYRLLVLAILLCLLAGMAPAAYAEDISVTATAQNSTPNYAVQYAIYNLPAGTPYDMKVFMGAENKRETMTEQGSWVGLTNNPSAYWASFSDTTKYTLPRYYICIEITYNGVTACSNIVEMTNSYYVEPELKITKSPTGEKVEEGGGAMFISSAENYSKVEWRIITKDTNNCWRDEQEIEKQFPDVEFNTWEQDGKEYMTLSNIPLSMNGYYIETKFWNLDGSKTDFTTSGGCLLEVYEAVIEKPTITRQPEGAQLELGNSLTLQAAATAAEGTLCWQWYMADANGVGNGAAIGGATGNQYIPEQKEGTAYYYCAVWADKDGKLSEKVLTSSVAVTYAAPEATPTPTPEATPETTPPTDPDPSPTADAAAAEEPITTPHPSVTGSQEKSSSGLLFILAAVIIAAILCLTVVLILMGREKKSAPADADHHSVPSASRTMPPSGNSAPDNTENGWKR